MKKKTKKIAILGTTPSRMEGPIEDESWQIWTIGPGGKDVHRWDRLLEAHGVWPEDFKGYLNDISLVKPPQQVLTLQPMEPAIRKWAKTHKINDKKLAKTITGNWSANIVIPKAALLEKYGRRMWFSSSIAWLIPLAIEEGATDIGLWGIDLESGEEYISQFVGCAHFLDLARLAGINIHLPEGSGLLRDPAPYPDRYENLIALTFEKKKKWLQGHLSNIEPEMESTRAEVHRQEGRLIMLRHFKEKVPDNVDDADLVEAERILVANNRQLGNIGANVMQLKGELSATEYYQRMFVWGFHDPTWSDEPH